MTNLQALPPRRRWLSRLALGLAAPTLLLCLGCAKNSDYSYSEAPAAMPEAQTVDVTGAQRYAYEGEGGYDFSDDLAKEEMGGADGSVLASRDFVTEDRDYGPPVRNQPGEPSTTEPTTGTGEPTVTSKDDQTPEHGRQIIYVAGMQVSVYNLESAISMVESLPDRFGGWVHMRNQSQVVLRLPADRLKPAMAELATLGVVEARTLQAQDVTAEYVDLESRIMVLRETQTQLLDLLGKAKTVEEALHVRKALDDVTMQLELALGRMRQLSDLIAYSTLTVTLVERGPQDHIPTSNDPFGWVDSLGVEATEWR
jgi:hypothetical protein